jgi:MOSC domain-containing protein YiiM
MDPTILSVNVGRTNPAPWKPGAFSAIDKRPVTGAVEVRALGIDGDMQANRDVHGGVDQAVYAFAREDLDWWAERLRRELSNGGFGENLTTSGLDVTAAVIGERWQVGTVTFEVSAPRIPCSNFQGFLGEQRWVKRFTQRARPGTYLRVLQEGTLAPRDAIIVTHRPAHGVTIGETFRALTTDQKLLPRLLEVPELPEEAHAKARRYLAAAAVEPRR